MTEPAGSYRGHVLVIDDGNELGHVLVDLVATPGERVTWGGRVLGSDYIVWGANHRKVQLVFDDGSTAEAVLRSGGGLRGLGEAPAVL